MRQISSRATFFVKRVYPIIFVAAVVLFFAFPLFWVERARLPSMWPLLLAMLVVLLVGYWLMKRMLFDLVDAVFDDGDALLVRNKKIRKSGSHCPTLPQRATPPCSIRCG